MLKLKNKNQKGSLMIEVLIVSAVIVGTFLVALSVAQKSIIVSQRALYNTQASFLLEEGAEIVRIVRDNDWDTIKNISDSTIYYPVFSGGVWTLGTDFNTVGIFTRTIEFDAVSRDDTTDDISASGTVDTGTKFVDINVSWSEGGNIKNRNLSFYISNLFEDQEE